MTNGAGANLNVADDFAAMRKLPPRIRELLIDSTTNASAESALRLKHRMGLDWDELYDELHERLMNIARETARQHYGPQHPQAKADCRWPLNPRSRRQSILSLDTRTQRL